MNAESLPTAGGALALGPALQYEVEQFLYDEAARLDERRYEAWFSLFASDIEYCIPVRMNRQRRDEDQQFSKPGEHMHMEDDHTGLAVRIKRIRSGAAWTEHPAPRMRRLVANVRLRLQQAPGELEVLSNFLVYRTRLDREMDLFAGQRTDTLRRAPGGGGFTIARRTVYLNQTTLLASSLSILF